jgi:dihydrofolate reductase
MARRKVTIGLATSLDNFIAREDGSCDWLTYGVEVAAMSKAYWQTIDVVLMGRKTWEIGGVPDAKATYVFSRTLKQVPGAEVVAEDAAKVTGRLKVGAGKGICVYGGGELARSLLDAGLVDEMVLNVHPILLGRGIPLFLGLTRQIDLELIDHRFYGKGNAIMSYRVLGGR